MWRVKVLLVLGIVAGMLLFPATALAAFGIDPGKIFIDNLHPGAQADIPITIYNHNDVEATYNVKPRSPDYTEAGYERLPYLGWVTVTPDRIAIEAHETAEVLVIVQMPDGADYSGKKSEVWVSFTEESAAGLIHIELASRLLITTRAEEPGGNNSGEPSEPVVIGGGTVGITAEAQKPESVTVAPSPTPPTPSTSPSPAAIAVPVFGVLIAGVTAFILFKRRRQA